MASDRIFDTIKLREEGKDIKKYAGNMFQELQNVSNEMKSSTACFDSDAGEDLRQNFKASAAKFEEFKKIMEDYGEYLVKLADQKEEMEKNLSAAGKEIPRL